MSDPKQSNPKNLTPPSFDLLKQANQKLKEVLALPKDEIVRDSTIQRFKFTVELAWKSIQKRLQYEGLTPSPSPKNLIREAAQQGWVQNPEKWMQLIDQRNLSSHTYNEVLAEEVYASAQETPPLVDLLLAIRPLKNHEARVWVFGSRARGDHKPFSDLDLLYECSEDLPKLLVSEIQENLENSNLPIKVDLVDLKNLVLDYREGILKDRIEV